MSLISPNVVYKAKKEKNNPPLYLQESEDANNEKECDMGTLMIKKRKKALKEEDEKVVVEQERQMKKLENVLFCSLYSPAETGKNDEERPKFGLTKNLLCTLWTALRIMPSLFAMRVMKYWQKLLIRRKT